MRKETRGKNRSDHQDPPPMSASKEGASRSDRSAHLPLIEGYEILGPLGEGGMGTVWRAVQLGTQQEIALKLMHEARSWSDTACAMFEREVRLAASIDHPNIARIYHGDPYNRPPYYTMQLVDGIHLDKFVENHQLSHKQILALVRVVCQAIQNAHQGLVIHRDLKFSNILVRSDGTPFVVDFGLAKSLAQDDDHTSITQHGDVAGTPFFMSPEQASGQVKRLDTRTDVYALGVILYRLLTGRFPHSLSKSRAEVLRRIAEEEVRRPKGVNKDLEALLLKALAKDSKDRYASAGELIQDINHYLDGDPLIARPQTWAYRSRKWLWKYRVPVGTVAAIMILVFSLISVGYVRERVLRERERQALLQEKAQRRIAEENQAKAKAAQNEAEKSAKIAAKQQILALQTLNKLVFEVQDRLKITPQHRELREGVFDIAIQGLRKVESSIEFSNTDGRLGVYAADSTVEAYTQLGVMYQTLGQLDDARRIFSLALTIIKSQSDAEPDDRWWQMILIQAYSRLGGVSFEMGDTQASNKYYQYGDELLKKLNKAEPGNAS